MTNTIGATPDLDKATPQQIERANAAVTANLNDDGSPKYDSAFGYACALTAIMQANGRGATPEERELIERLKISLLRIRARLGCVWRIGLIRRGTAFRWDMDAFLGRWS